MAQGPYTGSERARRAAARKRRKRRILRNRIIFGVVVLAALALLILGIVKLVGVLRGLGGGEDAPAPSATPAATPEPTPAPPVDFADARMVLVNNNTALPEGYAPETQVADANTQKQLETEAAQAFTAMQAAAKADGVSLILQSGYRSVEYQQGLFDQQVEKMKKKGLTDQAKTVVAVPGYSEHNTGYAADILTDSYRVMDSGFADTDAFAWLSENAAQYGFILRYPQDKSAITGIIYEPWHWRYLGPENARTVKESGLCLEEFWAKYTTGGDVASPTATPQPSPEA